MYLPYNLEAMIYMYPNSCDQGSSMMTKSSQVFSPVDTTESEIHKSLYRGMGGSCMSFY